MTERLRFLLWLSRIVKLRNLDVDEGHGTRGSEGGLYFAGGLDTRHGSDGEFSLAWRGQCSQIMFHVTTMMPSKAREEGSASGSWSAAGSAVGLGCENLRNTSSNASSGSNGFSLKEREGESEEGWKRGGEIHQARGVEMGGQHSRIAYHNFSSGILCQE